VGTQGRLHGSRRLLRRLNPALTLEHNGKARAVPPDRPGQLCPRQVGRDPIDQAPLANVATRHQATTAQVALAWLLATSPVTLAIPGTSSLDHLTENIAAAGLQLTADDLTELAG